MPTTTKYSGYLIKETRWNNSNRIEVSNGQARIVGFKSIQDAQNFIDNIPQREKRKLHKKSNGRAPHVVSKKNKGGKRG